jgi:hypothetical protein
VIRYDVATLLPHDAAEEKVRTVRDVARGRAHALAASFASYTEHNHYTRHRVRHPGTVLADRRLGGGDLLSVPELAALAHLPVDESIPGVQRAGARAISPPPGIATPGPDAKPLGVTDTGHERPVALRVPDARHHLHVIGATGSGKSTLLGNMILADAEAGRGIVLIDPKGDLVTDVLSRVPQLPQPAVPHRGHARRSPGFPGRDDPGAPAPRAASARAARGDVHQRPVEDLLQRSPEDARELSRHTAPRLSDHDLAHLGVYHAAVRLVLKGEEAQPFTMRTQPLPRAIPGRAREIRSTARRAQRTRTGAATDGGAAARPTQKSTTPSRPANRERATQPVVRPRNADPRRHG